VATDSVENLSTVRVAESVFIEIGSPNGAPRPAAVEKCPRVSGVSRVNLRAAAESSRRRVESSSNRSIRSDLARSVIDAGWNCRIALQP
jgi:hypothetical protein